MTEFEAWLKLYGITRTDYARAVGLSANTVHRRARGELGTPKEIAALIRLAPADLAMAISDDADGKRI